MHAYRALQQLAWPDVVRPATDQAARAYAELNAVDPSGSDVRAWRASYIRHLYREQPALMAALWLTAFPERLGRHVTYRGDEHLDVLREGPAVIALSRTSMSQAALWMLARNGHRAAIIIEPSMSRDDVAATVRRWGQPADSFTVIPADRRSLLHVRDALRAGRSIIVYPESRPVAGQYADVVPFLCTNIRVPAGAAVIAARFGAPLLPMRASIDRRRVVIEATAALHPGTFSDTSALNRALFGVLSQWVAEQPGQWVGWEHVTPAED